MNKTNINVLIVIRKNYISLDLTSRLVKNITDRLESYNKAVKTVLNESTHIPVPPMSSDINNSLIESFNKIFKV